MGRPTLRDVAEAAGVSTAAASVALADQPTKHVSCATRAAVRAAAARLGYERLHATPSGASGLAGVQPIGYVAVSHTGTLRVGRLHPDRLGAVRDAAWRNRAPDGPSDWEPYALVPAGRGGDRG